MAKPVRILIVDDHALVRKGLISLLALQENVEVVAEARNGDEAIEKAARLKPDVVLLDLVMPGRDGISAMPEILKQCPGARVLVLTSFSEDERVLSALEAGASGYLLKDCTPEELLQAIEAVERGENPMHPAVNQILVRQLNRKSTPVVGKLDALTDRERTVLELLALGFTNRQIADQLAITERTASTHVSRILGKVEAQNRTEAALLAIREGLVDLK